MSDRDDWATVEDGLNVLRRLARDFSGDLAEIAARDALARLRAADQAKTEALREIAESVAYEPPNGTSWPSTPYEWTRDRARAALVAVAAREGEALR